MSIIGDIVQGDTELVLENTVHNINATFQTDADPPVPLTPQALSLQITDLGGNTLVDDIYLPLAQRTPNPPRILNPSTGKYSFPFGLDNGSTDPLKYNKTSQNLEYLFTWRGATTASVRAAATIAPLDWSSVAIGTPGNFITIQYVNPGLPNQPLTLVRVGSTIQVKLATDGTNTIITTAGDVVALAALDASVSEIVTVAVNSGYLPPDPVPVTAATPLIGGVDEDGSSTVCVSVKVIPHKLCALLNKFRLMIDKTHKMVNNNPNDPCFLGYSNGQLWQYLAGGLQIINSYQPYVSFSFGTFPYGTYDFILLETSLMAGLLSQQLYAVDTDIPQWSDSGNAFVLSHGPQIAQYINFMSQRLDRLIPQFKLHFVNSGSIHVQMGPNYRIQQLIDASPNGSLFRNMFVKST